MGGVSLGTGAHRTSETSKCTFEVPSHCNGREGRLDLSESAGPGCASFLPSCWSCTRVDVEQRARYPWLTAGCDDVDETTHDIFEGAASADDSRSGRSQLLSRSKACLSSPAQIRPTMLDPEDSPVRQPALPITDSSLGAEEIEMSVLNETVDERGALAPTPPGESACHVSQGSPVSQKRQARKQTLDLGSSRFARPSEDSEFSLLYGANGKQPTAAKSMKLIVRHDRKQTWPSPAPAFESSTLYMTRRKNKYPHYEIRIQQAKPNAVMRNSTSTKWESEMKRTEVNFRQSLSLELLGNLVCGQGMKCEVRNNISAEGDHLGHTRPEEEYMGQSVQLYQGMDGNANKPKVLHSLLAAMEVGVAVACNRYDKMLPHDGHLSPLGQSTALPRTRSEDRGTFDLGLAAQDDKCSRSLVACSAPRAGSVQRLEGHRIRPQPMSVLAIRTPSHVWKDE